ncbi:MAG: glutathione S-transferase [Hyphomicrobiales bacterium]|nr:glutathione S-transferase [Hyphomicrobiales bacterium]
MLRIFGRLSSLNTQKVMFCVYELGLEHELVAAGREFGVVDTPDYRALNPNGLVPTLVEDGFALWESNAIIRYLCAQHSRGDLWPEDARERALADSWMDWQQTQLQRALHPELHSLSSDPGRFTPERIEAARMRCETLMDMLDSRLGQVPFVSGARFGMADCAMAPPVHRWMNLAVERGTYRAVEDWFGRVSQRPAARKTLPAGARHGS